MSSVVTSWYTGSMRILGEPLTAAAYAPYGDVLSADRDDIPSKPANQGTAQRRDFQVGLANLRPSARANFASFRCTPVTTWPLELTLLEKHSSTQVFLPMNARRYLVVVALGGDAPDLPTLRAFVAQGTQAVSYRPGVWHHPMIALDAVTDFACLVWEDGTSADCTEVALQSGVRVALR